eukprot:4694663-Amphidinium_carterae.1
MTEVWQRSRFFVRVLHAHNELLWPNISSKGRDYKVQHSCHALLSPSLCGTWGRARACGPSTLSYRGVCGLTECIACQQDDVLWVVLHSRRNYCSRNEAAKHV